MSLLIIGALAAIVLTIVFAIWANADCEWYNTFAAIVAFLAGSCALISVIVICILGFSWTASDYKTKIINREYNVEYTREEIFYASDVIETIKQLDRKRLEVNGNILDKE